MRDTSVISVCVISTSTNAALIRIGGATLSVSYCFAVYVLWENVFNWTYGCAFHIGAATQQATAKKWKRILHAIRTPTHSLTHSFLQLHRTHKHTLILSFAQVTPTPAKERNGWKKCVCVCVLMKNASTRRNEGSKKKNVGKQKSTKVMRTSK